MLLSIYAKNERYTLQCLFFLLHLMCLSFTESLSSVLRSGVLVGLSKRSSPEEWNLISRNTMYILKCVLNGLKYLEDKNMQHCDVKGSLRNCGYS